MNILGSFREKKLIVNFTNHNLFAVILYLMLFLLLFQVIYLLMLYLQKLMLLRTFWMKLVTYIKILMIELHFFYSDLNIIIMYFICNQIFDN